MTVKSARCAFFGMIQYLFGLGVGSLSVMLSPTFGYTNIIAVVVLIPLIAFVWPFIEVRLIEHGWIKP